MANLIDEKSQEQLNELSDKYYISKISIRLYNARKVRAVWE